jgi:tRNA dimethylallyltransferase
MKSGKPRLIVLLGPTAVGKTALALALAQRWRAEILSADSMQVYRGMDIGTAKPTRQERSLVPHHLLDLVDPADPFDASRYLALARAAIERLHGEGKPLLVVGGTGLYLRALLGGLIDGPGADEGLRAALREEIQRRGKPWLHERLRQQDERAAARINPNDGVRVIRALEVLAQTGRSIVDVQRDHGFGERPYEVLKLGLTLERERLNERIDRRVETMIAAGLVEEVRTLLLRGYGRELKAMQSLGYRHIGAHLAGEGDLSQAVRLIQRDTRHYARRQMTWFSADPEIRWLAPDDRGGATAACERFWGGP